MTDRKYVAYDRPEVCSMISIMSNTRPSLCSELFVFIFRRIQARN